MKHVTNYYCLTRKQLEPITFIEPPVVSTISQKRLSRPVVLEIAPSGDIIGVFSLQWYKEKVNGDTIVPGFSYEIRSMY